ncbi:MAG: fatty acid desaturase [Halobacteriovoraceae bacterium]|nr:fatty acid desaturase [Halobacteriovoraceae bacterium]
MENERLQTLKSDYSHLLKADDKKAWPIVIGVTATSLLGISLSDRGEASFWLLGQILLGISILQWFFLVHDFGHNNYFSSKKLNTFWGHVASLFCILPFFPWRYIHRGHHYWTGWKDKDPTMAVIVPRDLSAGRKSFINFCWKVWIPIFSVSFSLSNFWNLKKLNDLFPDKTKEVLFSIILLPVFYGFIISLVGWGRFLEVWGLAYFLFLFLSDPLLLSQHSSVPQNYAGERKVSPVPFKDQDQFTRTLIFPNWVTKYLLLSFNNHIVHHVFPTMPGYNLYKVQESFPNETPWKDWLWEAKKTTAVDLLFSEERNIVESDQIIESV